MIEDERVGSRHERAIWLYLSDIKDKTERSLSEQAAILKLLWDIRLCLLAIIGFSGVALLLYLGLPRLFFMTQ